MASTYLGVELGSTRIKAVAVDGAFAPVSSGDYTWQSRFENGVWTYDLDEVWTGMRAAIAGIDQREAVCAAGISGMMHGYLAFDADWNLLVPFRTWQNTITAQAARALTELFSFNIPQRWSIAHLYQAILNEEPHVKHIAHITTLAGYVHHALTGVNAVGVGEASGIFPIDSETGDYDAAMIAKFDALLAARKLPFTLRQLMPAVLPAGAPAGQLTDAGSALLNGLLPAGLPLCPPEGDAGTGMTATNAVAPRTGNISAGTSIFSMVVLEKPLATVHEEIDIVATPEGAPVAMVHCNNCTGDFNAWAGIIREAAALFGAEVTTDELYRQLYEVSLTGEEDCGGVLVCNYLAGEGVTHLDEGRPLVTRKPGSSFTLGNFMRAQLYAAMATLSIGMETLAEEGVKIDALTGHGGLFKTPLVGQQYMAAACDTPITCMETAGEGGPYGMALLAAYMCLHGGASLGDFLDKRVFAATRAFTYTPNPRTAYAFSRYMKGYRALLAVEKAAIDAL